MPHTGNQQNTLLKPVVIRKIHRITFIIHISLLSSACGGVSGGELH